MTAENARRYVSTACAFIFVTCLLGGLFQANVQEWAKATGNDQYLVQYAGIAVAKLVATTQTGWFLCVTVLFVTGSVFLWVRYFFRRRSPPKKFQQVTNHDESAPSPYVVNVQMGQSGGANPNLIIASFESSVSGRIRIYIEHALLNNNEPTKPIKILIADFADAFRGQLLNVTVLRRNYYFDKDGEKQWDFRFGPEGVDQNNSSYMADFKYRTRLIFEGPDGDDQFYNFQIIQPDTIVEEWVPKITTQDDTKPW